MEVKEGPADVAIKVDRDGRCYPVEVIERAFLDYKFNKIPAPLYDDPGNRIGTVLGVRIEPNGTLLADIDIEGPPYLYHQAISHAPMIKFYLRRNRGSKDPDPVFRFIEPVTR